MKRQETGKLGESLARDFLKERGYHILETNYRCPQGEIDIITLEKEPGLHRGKDQEEPQLRQPGRIGHPLEEGPPD